MSKQTLTRDIYDAFQKQELQRWKTTIAPDVTIDSPAGRGFKGLDVLTGWAIEFGGKLAYRINLVDEHLALDAEGNSRGFITFNRCRTASDIMKIGEIAARLLHDAERPQTAAGMLESLSDNGQL